MLTTIKSTRKNDVLIVLSNLFFIVFAFSFSLSTYGQEIEKSIFITANTGDAQNNEVLSQIVKDAEKTPNSLLLMLGNAVPKGNFKNAIDQQLKIVEGLKKDVIFIPGKNEWLVNGFKGVEDLDKYVKKNSEAKFYPNDGEPIKKRNISDNIVLITIDSQWFLENWNKHVNINQSSEIENRNLFFLEFENQIKKAQGKIKIVAIHHPIETLTKQGLIKNTAAPSVQNFRNKQHKTLRNRLKTLARLNDDIIFVSGRDQNLQYINKSVPQIISGAAGTTKNVNNAKDGGFSLAKKGYSRLDIDTYGKVTVEFFTVGGGTSKSVFNSVVFKGHKDDKNAYSTKNSFSPTQKASVYTKEATDKSGFYKSLWGDHYREFYSKQVNAKVVSLDTLLGGLTPLKRGGGQQSKSLRLEDSSGKQFVMRALKKSTIKFLQANAFQDVYIGDALDGTVVDKFLADFYTTSHPYTAFAIGGLSDAVEVSHTNPKLYYVPKQKTLGVYNDEFGDELYMIEEHVGGTQTSLESFGSPIDILSTADVLQEIHKSGKSVVDESSYIKARMFDMLIGDWDRHEDQWRWALFKNEDGTEYCKPIPRDRDQAFSKFDGSLISLLTRAIPPLRKMQSFDEDLRSAKWFATNPYRLDVTIINDSDWNVWEEQTKYLQTNMTDEVIEKAFEDIPDEMKGETIEDIKKKLKGRRNNLLKIAREYYVYLNKFEVITGTQKDDEFKITRLPDGKTTIEVHKNEAGTHSRTFSKDITKEIWIYGLDGKDTFVVEGDGSSLIPIRVMGGKNNDTYNFKNKRKVKLYDYKSKKNTIVEKGSKKWLVDDYDVNNYDHRKVKSSFNQLLPIVSFNPDDGVILGLSNTNLFYGIQKNPFTQKHVVSAAFYTSTTGVNLKYSGEFSNIFHGWNFGIEGRYTSPNFAENFFGFGNETLFDSDAVDLDFNRVRIRQWNAAISLIYRGRNGGAFHIKPLVESFEVENTEDRFINTLDPNSTFFENQTYGGGEFVYEYKNKDNPAFPRLGMDLSITGGYKTNIDNSSADNNFGYIIPELAFDHRINRKGSLVLATKLAGEVVLGDDFEFYHGAQIGGVNGLRGFRNERFVGKRSFYQNTDLRLALGGLRTSVLPLRFGISGGFDYGRVWEEDNTSNVWHTSGGGSLWLSGVDSISANLGFYNSSDGGRVVFVFGFAF